MNQKQEINNLAKHLSSKLGADNRVVLNAIAGYMGFRNFQAVVAKLKRGDANVVSFESDEDAYRRYCNVVNQQGWNEDSQIIHLEGFIGQTRGMLSKLADYAESVAKEECDDCTEKDVYVSRVLSLYEADKSGVYAQYAAAYGATHSEAGQDTVSFLKRCAEQDFHDGDSGAAVFQDVYDEVTGISTPGLKSMEHLLALWRRLGDIPTVFEGPNVDEIEEPFLHFPVGTHRETIWHWFEEQNPLFLVGEVMSGKTPRSKHDVAMTNALTGLAMDDGSFDVPKARKSKVVPMRSMLHVVIANDGNGEEFDWFLTEEEADAALVAKSYSTPRVRKMMVRTPQWDMTFAEVSEYIWDEFINIPVVDKTSHAESVNEKLKCSACGLPTSVDDDGLCNACSDISEKIEYDSVSGDYMYLKSDSNKVVLSGVRTMTEAISEVLQYYK